MEEKIPPQNLEAEQSVLGAMMMSKDAIAAIVSRLQPEDYYKDSHMHIYRAMTSLYQKGEPIDLVTIAQELKKQDTLDAAGGKSYLVEIVNSVPTAANVDYYADIVLEKSLLRTLIDTGSELVTNAFDDTLEVDEIVNDAQRKIMDITKVSSKEDMIKLGEVVGTVWDEIAENKDDPNKIFGIQTGYTDLDKLTLGFQKSDLIILAARPAIGKTALAMNFAIRAALNKENKKTVGIFSLEMPKEQLALRVLSSVSQISQNRLKTANIAENEWKLMTQALGSLSEANLFIDDTAGISPLALRAKCRRLQMEVGLDLIIVDYLQLMKMGKKRIESRFQEVSEIVRDLKALAKELQLPIIALSQLSRDVEKRGGAPKLSDLRESGEIEQTADLVMFIHREDYYEQGNATTSPTRLDLAKHRNGPTGKVDFIFRKDVSRFELTSKSPVAV